MVPNAWNTAKVNVSSIETKGVEASIYADNCLTILGIGLASLYHKHGAKQGLDRDASGKDFSTNLPLALLR
jgi:hypothetical protein